MNNKRTQLENDKGELKICNREEKRSAADAKSKIKPLPSKDFEGNHQHLLADYKGSLGFVLISLGLSFPVLIAVADMLGVQLNNLTEDKYLLLAISVIVACCLSMGVKEIMMRVAESSYRFDPKRSFPDDSRYANQIAWWTRLAKGSGAFYLGLFFVSSEVAFVTVGLIGVLPPNLSDNPLIIFTVVAGAALFAAVNVSLGYIVGVQKAERASYQREFYQKRNEIQNSPEEAHIKRLNAYHEGIIAQAEAKIAYMTSEIEAIDREIEVLESADSKTQYDDRTNKQPQDSTSFSNYNPAPRSTEPLNNHSDSRL